MHNNASKSAYVTNIFTKFQADQMHFATVRFEKISYLQTKKKMFHVSTATRNQSDYI